MLAAIALNGATMTASNGGTYQWIDCGNGQPIAGATGQTFTPAQSGSYAVIVTDGPCSDTSACQVVVGRPNAAEGELMVYPNPSNGLFQVRCADAQVGMPYTIYAAEGRLVASGTVNTRQMPLDLRHLATGSYVIRIGDGTARFVIQ